MSHVYEDGRSQTKLTITAEKRYCNVLFWNIHGQKNKTTGNKFTDIEFLNICPNVDILGICELHTNDKPSIKGFKLIKNKIRKKIIKDLNYMGCSGFC